MRWIPTLILAYLVVLAQTTIARVLAFQAGPVGTVMPDLAAVVAVFVALRARSGVDVMLCGWVLGLGVDLTTAGGVGASTAVGPMSIFYALCAGCVYRVREAFFHERALTQAFLALMFCLAAHGLWLSVQSLLNYHDMTWGAYLRALVQGAALALYTALLMPLGHVLLRACHHWFMAAPAGQRGRR